MEIPTFKDIADLHEYVFQLLLKEHEKDNSFLFTLRQPHHFRDNLQNHWFYSQDNDSLYFTFWKGNDPIVKIPYVHLYVNVRGTCLLKIENADNNAVISGFAHWVKSMIGECKIEFADNNYIKRLTKRYNTINDIENIVRDKRTIDEEIKTNRVIGKQRYFDKIKDISDQEFETNLLHIEKLRKNIGNQTSAVKYKINLLNPQSLSLKNISHFSELEIDLSHRITCIIGENGSGKSSILKAIALSLVGTDKKRINASHRSLVNLLKITGLDVKSGEKELALAGEIALTYNEKYRNAIHFQFEYGDLSIKDEGNFENIHSTYYFPHLILAFPQLQGKNENGNVTSLIEQDKPNIKDIRALIYGEAENPFEKLEGWITSLYAEGNTKEREKSKQHAIIAQLFEIISAVTGAEVRFITVVYEGENQIVWVSTPDAPNGIPLSLISQGYSNVFGWIGYFMKRLAEVNQDAEDFTQCPAIVLIDEIDTYLHPKWQETILRILADKFPQTQFIVTTHSPFVISSVKHSDMCIYSLESKGNEMICREIEENVYGADRNTSAEVLGTKERLQEPLDKINTLFNLIYDNSLLEAENYLQTQFTDMNLEDEELQKAKKLIDTKKRLLQR